MALEQTEAVVLKMFNWSESSRTVHFFTRDFGRLPLVDKGGRSFKSRRGRLTMFARMDLTFYSSQKETSGYIRDCDLLELFSFEKDGTLGRLAYASAACELLFLLLPEAEPQPALYAYLLTYHRLVDHVEKRHLPALFLAFLLRVLSQLGYHPSLEYCVTSGQAVSQFIDQSPTVQFSPERGGVVSPSCQKPGEYYIDLTLSGHSRLVALQRSSLPEAAAMTVGYQETVRLIDALARFVRYQAEIPAELRSLAFLDKLKESQLNGY